MFILAIHTSISYAQVQDNTIAGIIVPKVISTQNHYCINGICGTGKLAPIPSNYTHSNVHLPVLLINWSQTCEMMMKNNIKGCTSIEQMIPFDTSNQYVSGKFVKQGNETIRTKPQIQNNWLYYKYSGKQIVCVECSFDIPSTQESQQIIIQPTTYSFVDKNVNNATKSYTYFNDRFMQGCDTATISSIPGLLNDTIHYMLSGCKTTNFNGNVTKSVHNTPWDYDNPYSTLHLSRYLKFIIPNHSATNTNHTSGGYGPSDCIRHSCGFKDPYSRSGW